MNEPLRSAVAKPGMFYLSKKAHFYKIQLHYNRFFSACPYRNRPSRQFFSSGTFFFSMKKTAAGHTARRCFVNHIRE